MIEIKDPIDKMRIKIDDGDSFVPDRLIYCMTTQGGATLSYMEDNKRIKRRFDSGAWTTTDKDDLPVFHVRNEWLGVEYER